MDSHSFEGPPGFENSNDFGDSNPKLPQWISLTVAWVAILASILWVTLPHFAGGKHEEGESSIVGPEIYGKYLIGLSSLPFVPKDDFQDVISSIFANGPLRQRLMGTVLVGEFDGPEAALKSLQQLEKSVETRSITASQADDEVLHILLKMQQSRIDGYDVESQFDDDEIRRLREFAFRTARLDRKTCPVACRDGEADGSFAACCNRPGGHSSSFWASLRLRSWRSFAVSYFRLRFGSSRHPAGYSRGSDRFAETTSSTRKRSLCGWSCTLRSVV